VFLVRVAAGLIRRAGGGRVHYGVAASALHRDQAARLTAILPNPIRRKPARMNQKGEIILTRMRQMGW
jgi:monofunctional glycosyltransferase